MKRAAAIVISAAAVLAILVLLRRPSNARDWATDQKVLATAAIRGDLVEIRNVRNFKYRSESDYTPKYETRTYDPRKLDSV